MPGSKVNGYGIGDVNLTKLMQSVDAQRKGFCAISLTEYETDSEPAIAAGSAVEVNGALFKFDTEEEISGSPSDGDVYVMLVADGDSIIAEFINTEPVWSDSKQGWYGTGDDANNRYIASMVLDSGEYRNKYVYYSRGDIMRFETLSDKKVEQTLTQASPTLTFTFTFPWDISALVNTFLLAKTRYSSGGSEYTEYFTYIDNVEISGNIATITIKADMGVGETVWGSFSMIVTGVKKIV